MNARTLSIACALGLLVPVGLLAADSTAATPATAPAGESRPAALGKPEPCPLPTGSHIAQKPGQCHDVGNVRKYTQEQLQSTGESNLAEALRKLDPIFR